MNKTTLNPVRALLLMSLAVGFVALPSMPSARAESPEFQGDPSKWALTNAFRHYRNNAPRMSPVAVQSRNRTLLESLGRAPRATESLSRTKPRLAGVTRVQAGEILRSVMNNPIASLNAIEKYDPEGGIGFCFGRAMTAHLESLMYGLAKPAIKKLWAVGDLRTGDTEWGWHVTTIVRSRTGGWYTIDPIFGTVLTVEQWYREMQRMDYDGKMMLYVSDAPQFAPDGSTYQMDDLLMKSYNQYFRDLMGYFRKKNAERAGRITH